MLKIGQSAKVKEKRRAFEVISELLRRNYTFGKYLSVIGIPFALFTLKIASFFMNKMPFFLLALVLIAYTPSFAQKKLKKSDRTIVSNIRLHETFLKGEKLDGRKAGTDGEKLAGEYIPN